MALIYNELPTAFVWYDKKEKQQRYRENAQQSTSYKLISPNGRLLPFQFRLDNPSTGGPVSWKLYRADDDTLAADISSYMSYIVGIRLDTGLYATHLGTDMQFNVEGEEIDVMPEDCYYSVIEFSTGVEGVYVSHYSEIFMMVADLSKYIKIEYWNTCDIDPIAYNIPLLKQLVYLDTFIHASEPEIEEDGERDGQDQIIPTFQKMVVKYRFSVVVPDYMKIAIVSMQMHDNVILTTENGIRTGNIEKMTTTSTVEASGAYSTVDVLLEQLLISKDACCTNIAVLEPDPWA